MNQLSKNQVTLFDTSIATNNVGDEIIMDAVNREIYNVFAANRICRVASHDKIGISGLSLIRHSDFGIVGGSNILSSKMNKYKQWKLDLFDVYFIPKNVLLLGVGWRQYQQQTNFYTKTILRKILTTDALHSVRDKYTQQKLADIGIHNVINTGCPTMWTLTKAHCATIPQKKSDKVIFTLTDYDCDEKADKHLVEILLRNYKEVYFWPQGRLDASYLERLTDAKIQIVNPNLKSYDFFLENNDCDYIGTRLHGGIRALQKGRRTVIIGIDNRAIEKQKDFNLPVVLRSEIDTIENVINSDLLLDIAIPLEDINRWKNQFSK